MKIGSGTKIVSAAALLALLFASPSLSAEPRRLTILHFNDLHGHLEVKPDEGGAARIASIVKRVRAENSRAGVDTLVFFGGDAFTGTLISNEYEGAAEFDFLDSLDIDAMVIGNHEFDFGVPRFEELASSAEFPILSANIFWKEDGRRFANPCAVTKSGVGVVGLTTEQTRTSTLPENVAMLRFTSPVKAALSAMKSKECRAPVMIALTHLGVQGDIALAEKAKGFAAVIGGHDHVSPDHYCRTVNGVPVCQTPPNGRYVGRVDLTLEGNRVIESEERLIPVDGPVPQDRATASLVERYAKNLSGKYDRVVGKATEDLPMRGKGQTKLGAIVAESMRRAGQSKIAFINSTGIRAPLKKGDIRLRDLAEVLPFRNYVVVMNLSGAEIEKVLLRAIGRRGEGGLQVAGISFDVSGKKPVNIEVDGRPIARSEKYVVSTVDFLASGGSGFSILKKISDKRPTGILVRDAAAEYIKSKRVVP